VYVHIFKFFEVVDVERKGEKDKREKKLGIVEIGRR